MFLPNLHRNRVFMIPGIESFHLIPHMTSIGRFSEIQKFSHGPDGRGPEKPLSPSIQVRTDFLVVLGIFYDFLEVELAW